MSNTPSDAEISAVVAAAKVKCVHPEAETTIDIARAVLAKWGTPQPAMMEALTDEQIKSGACYNEIPTEQTSAFISGARFAERIRNIRQKGGSNAE